MVSFVLYVIILTLRNKINNIMQYIIYLHVIHNMCHTNLSNIVIQSLLFNIYRHCAQWPILRAQQDSGPKISFYIFLISVWNLPELFTHSWKAVMLQSYRYATNGNVNVIKFISQMIFFKNNSIWLISNTPKIYNTIKQVGSKSRKWL